MRPPGEGKARLLTAGPLSTLQEEGPSAITRGHRGPRGPGETLKSVLWIKTCLSSIWETLKFFPSSLATRASRWHLPLPSPRPPGVMTKHHHERSPCGTSGTRLARLTLRLIPSSLHLWLLGLQTRKRRPRGAWVTCPGASPARKQTPVCLVVTLSLARPHPSHGAPSHTLTLRAGEPWEVVPTQERTFLHKNANLWRERTGCWESVFPGPRRSRGRPEGGLPVGGILPALNNVETRKHSK